LAILFMSCDLLVEFASCGLGLPVRHVLESAFGQAKLQLDRTFMERRYRHHLSPRASLRESLFNGDRVHGN
jgi:hypothetical protein